MFYCNLIKKFPFPNILSVMACTFLGSLIFNEPILAKAKTEYADDLFDEDDSEDDSYSFKWIKQGFDARGPYYANLKKKKKRWAFFDLEANAGYRSDHYRWDMYAPNAPGVKNIDSKIHDINIAQVGVLAKLHLGNLYIAGTGDWGKICSGKETAIIANSAVLPPPAATFHANVNGHVEDYTAALGYYIKLYSSRRVGFYIAPEVGYEWNFQHWIDKHVTPSLALGNPSSDPTGLITDIHLTYNHSNPKTRWNGPYVGLNLLYQYQKWELELGGNYEWLEENFDNLVNSQLFANMAGFPITLNSMNHLRGNFHTKYAYLASLKLKYHLTSHWHLDLYGSYRQAQVKDGDLKNSIHVAINMPPGPQVIDHFEIQPSTNRWESWSALLAVGYIF